MRASLWAVLAAPAVAMVAPIVVGHEPYRHAIRPSGEAGAVLVILALSIAPIKTIFPASRLLAWLARRRRDLGIAGFCYALLHMIVFALAIGRLDHILQGMAFASMWTGWVAFALLAVVATVSNDGAMQALGRGWKRIQRLVYPAAVLTLTHWLLLTRSPVEALAWFGPLAVLEAYRLWTVFNGKRRGGRR